MSVKNSQFTKAVIDLPPGFLNHIKNVMEDEVDVAKRKWNVALKHVERVSVVENSIKQLYSKMYSVFGFIWDGSDTLYLKIHGGESGERSVREGEGDPNRMLVRTKDGWTVEGDEKSNKSIPYPQLYSEVVGLIENWARTAVFYGVGSIGQLKSRKINKDARK